MKKNHVKEEVTEKEFTLSKEITFHKGGESVSTNKLFLKAPSVKSRRQTRFLKQCFFRAIKGAQSDGNAQAASQSQGKPDDIKANDILMLLMGSDLDISDCLEALQIILCNGACEIDDGGVVLPVASYTQINDDDQERLLGEYLSTFLLSFWLKQLT